MKHVINPARHDQDNMQKMTLAGTKDGVVTILWVVEGFQLIDHIACNQLIDRIHQQRQAGDADNAVDLALFITDADDHAFFSDGTYFQGVRFKFVENFRVKFPHLSGGDEGCFQAIPAVVLKDVPRPDLARYARKYIRKETMLRKTVPSRTASL